MRRPRPVIGVRNRWRAFALRNVIKSPRLRTAIETPISVGTRSQGKGRQRGQITQPLIRCGGDDLVTGARYSARVARRNRRKKREEIAAWHDDASDLLGRLAEEVGVSGRVTDLPSRRLARLAEEVADLRDRRPPSRARVRAGQGIAGYAQ